MTTTTASPVTTFDVAQTFFVDPGSVANAPEASLTGVGLYFQTLPKRTGNKSGITAPGVSVFLCPTVPNGTTEVPYTASIVAGAIGRVEYDSITVSNNASVETVINFPAPVNVDTGQTYAIVIKYDGDEAFVLWTSVVGQTLVGTNTPSSGPTGKYVGAYFQYSYVTGLAGSTSNTALNTSSAGNVTGTWKPLSSTDLKFNVYVAKFVPDVFANTTSVDSSSGVTTTNVVAERSFLLYKKPYEFVEYNAFNSSNVSSMFGGEVVYQNNVIRPESVSVVSGLNVVTSATANFSTIFGNANTDKWVVFYSGQFKNVRKITSIQSNNALTVDIPLTFSNGAAAFSRVVAGKLDLSSKVLAFGKIESMIAIDESSANSSLRFTNNVLETVTIGSTGGSGYANTDYLVVSGGGLFGGAAEANAVANLTTNSTGGIVSFNITNKGVGFLNAPTTTIFASNGASSNGSGANVQVGIGMTLMTQFSNAVLSNCHIINIPVNTTLLGAVDVENPYGTSYYLKKHYMYYALSDGVVSLTIANGGVSYSNNDTVTFTGGGGSGASYRITTDSTGKIISTPARAGGNNYTSAPTPVINTSTGTGGVLTAQIGIYRNNLNTGQTTQDVTLFNRQQLSYANTPLMLSRSIEVMQPNSSFVTDTGVTVNTNISSVVEMVTQSNNVYVVADILSSEVDVFYEKFAINNDYTNENTGQGSAVSKHISKIFNFGNDTTAEDIRVYADVYRPANTNVVIFAKIYNAKDPAPFVEKDWTMLSIVSGANTYSTAGNEQDLVEITYGFPQYPNTAFTGTGTVTTALNSATLTGSNTAFNTQFAVGNVVKLWSPLFPTNYKISVINSISSATSLTLYDPIVNNDVVGAGFNLDLIAYPKQAFNNFLNNNVVRYYGANTDSFDGFNSFAIKIVFLSDNSLVVPKVDSIRAIGVTA